jgi:hypothetical protein
VVPSGSAETLKKALEKKPADKETSGSAPAKPSDGGALPQVARGSAAPTVATTDHPWRHLHPSRVWPD